jgi:hypothetical protein
MISGDVAKKMGVRNRAFWSLLVPDTMRPVVLSVRSFTSIASINGGDTVVVRFQAPDGRDIALLVPK